MLVLAISTVVLAITTLCFVLAWYQLGTKLDTAELKLAETTEWAERQAKANSTLKTANDQLAVELMASKEVVKKQTEVIADLKNQAAAVKEAAKSQPLGGKRGKKNP